MACKFCSGESAKVFGTIFCIHETKSPDFLDNGVIIRAGSKLYQDKHEARLGLKLCFGGRQEVTVSGKRYVMFPDQILLVNAGEKYETQFQSFGISGAVISIGLSEQFVKRYVSENSELFHINSNGDFREGLYNIDKLPSGFVQSLVAAESIETGFFGDILQSMFQIHKKEIGRDSELNLKKVVSRADISKKLRLAKDFLQSNIETNPSLTDVASQVGLSTNHFRKLFKVYYKKSPHDYLIELKLQRAANLLLNTNLPINRIGEQSGYENPSAFIRAFKLKYGYTPGEFGTH